MSDKVALILEHTNTVFYARPDLVLSPYSYAAEVTASGGQT